MGMPIHVFPASQLPQHLETDVSTGRRRKVPIGDLSKCPLVEILQWDCQVEGEQIRCWPIERLFRKCKDVTVEVTAVEAGR
ncbi:hypothetical protein Q9L58_001591 [Maublancomyces gigas]|uniref:Uncharacterized protein n=1 Tax=Discina gigas TaxID=1032678 RepID=A0ABR3GTV5_9PEZI